MSCKSLVFAIVFIAFFIFINFGFYKFNKIALIKDLNIFAFVFLGTAILLIESAYKNEKASTFRQHFLAFVDGYQIKGRKNHAVFHLEFSHHIDYFFFQMFVVIHTVFQFNIGNQSRILYPGQILPQRWNPLKVIFPFKLSVAVNKTQFLIRIITNISCSTGRSVNGLIMHDHDLIVFRQLDIQLDAITANFFRFFKCQHSIFRIFSAESSMCKYLHYYPFFPVFLNFRYLIFHEYISSLPLV